jgi:hypothetical protein
MFVCGVSAPLFYHNNIPKESSMISHDEKSWGTNGLKERNINSSILTKEIGNDNYNAIALENVLLSTQHTSHDQPAAVSS